MLEVPGGRGTRKGSAGPGRVVLSSVLSTAGPASVCAGHCTIGKPSSEDAGALFWLLNNQQGLWLLLWPLGHPLHHLELLGGSTSAGKGWSVCDVQRLETRC